MLAKAKAPRLVFIVIQLYLILQFAKDFAAFLENFSIFIYGNLVRILLERTTRITSYISQFYSIFNATNKQNV